MAGRDFVANEKPDAPRELFPTNPTVSEWSYGSRPGPVASRELVLADRAQHSNAQEGREDFEGFFSGGGILANTGTQPLLLNFGFGDLHPLQASEMYLGPSPNTDAAVVRWTAPITGSYRIAATWRDLDNHGGNGASGHVVINGTERFAQEWNNDGGAQFPAQTFTLNAGDVVDFCLGARGEFSFDATAFDATISRLDSSPASFLANTGFTVFDRLQPLANAADSVLTFASAQSSTASGLSVRVQSTTTPGNASSWTELPDGNFGLMVLDVSTGLWVLNSTNYPRQNGIYFRAVSVATDLPANLGNAVGPFNLASNVAQVGPTVLRVNGEGGPSEISPREPLSFSVQGPAGVKLVSIETSSTPHEENSWADLPGGDLGPTSQPGEYGGSTTNYPLGTAVYFRAVTTKTNATASLSNIVGPFDFTAATNPAVTGLWEAGRNFAANEKPDRASETNSVNQTVPEWSYGFRASASGNAFTPFSAAEHVNNMPNPGIDGFGVSGTALTVAVNAGATPVIRNGGFGNHKPILPGQLLLHPSSSNAFPVVRWTAPAAGSYRILAKWIDLDPFGGNGASAHVTINGTEVFGRKVPADPNGPARFVGQEWENGGNAAMPAETFRLNAGDVVDFLVGSRGDFAFDSTTFNALIRKVPTVTLPGVQAESITLEGADLAIPVQVEWDRPISTVILVMNGQPKTSDQTAPYELRVPNIASGTHYFSVVVRDDEGLQSVSETFKLTVLKSSAAAAARAGGSKGEVGSAAAASLGRTYTCTQSGIWSNPATWGGAGVPTRSDDAIIPAGFAVNVQARTDVLNLEAAGSIVIGIPGSPQTLTIYGTLQASGEISGAIDQSQLIIFNRLNCLAGTAFFRDLSLIVSGETVISDRGGIRSANCVISTSGFTSLFAPAGTNRPIVASADRIDLSGRVTLGSTAQLIARSLTNDGAAIVAAGGGNLVSPGGGNIVAAGGGNLLGQDGNSLRGPDGLSFANLKGLSLIGQDGNSLIGQDGASMVAAGGGNRPVIEPDAPQVDNPITLARGTVSGRLNFVGDVVNSGAYILPGESPGTITISGNYTQSANGALVLEVGGTGTDPLQFDQLLISGTANLNGRLVVQTINGFVPQAGDVFTPLTYGAVNGTFSSVTSNGQVSFGPNGMTLQVNGPNPPAPKALNISTRMRVEAGDNVLIAGFIVTGSQPKKVIIRGLGPSLPVAGALADPILELDGGAVTNDSWRSTQESEIIATTIPPSSNLEAAIVATLAPGGHTAILRGKNNGTGVGLVEVYDLEPNAPAQLANISTRGLVQTGDDVMIGGFIVGGTYPAKVIVRAIGPSLSQQGVSGALQDTTLELVDSQGNILSNDDWRSTQEAEIIATTVPPTNEKEAAIVATLVPGNYTAIVRGKDGTTGIALVEGYTL